MARRMKRIIFAALLAILSFPAIPWASSEATLFSLLGFDSIREMMPEGRFVVYVSKGDKWQEAGNLSFNRIFVEKELDLSKHLLGNDRTKIRLVQKGGGASHIDSVFLGGMPPTEIKGAQDDRELKKLSRRDFDVIDAFGREMELSFPRGKDGALRLAARVEGTRIGEVPFQFPLENLCKSMSERSAFYTYRMVKDRPGDQPFFKEYSVTGSGHPSGYTYGWVWNDDQNLYVRIDFTPDDTMDGDKDYAKVYVKTEGGVKEFKLSESETTWGRPDFRYTDKVVYEHKVYDFKIPLKEIGLMRTEEEKKLLLAFAAYGTAAVQITSVPTLNAWGMSFSIILFGAGSIYCFRRRGDVA
jgi:hypothetical protein